MWTREQQRATGVLLALDAAAVEVGSALAAAGVRPVLLKGPSITHWLYDHPADRVYSDIDLLVAPSALSPATTTLEGLGFRYVAESWSSSVWVRRGSGVNVDLHTALLGVGLPPEPAFAVLTRKTETLQLARGTVTVLALPARTVHVVLHATQHGALERTSLEDLRRSLANLSPAAWEEASALAAELQAVPAFGAGLRLLPEGRALAETLGLPTSLTTLVAMRAASAPPVSEGLMSLAATPGFGPKLRLIAREVAPTSAYLRTHIPIARRGRLGLAVARVWRPIWLLLRLGPALVAILRARRHARGAP